MVAEICIKEHCFLSSLSKKNIHVMYVQETHSDCFNESDWKKEWEGEVVFAHMSSTRGGVAILFAKKALPFSCEVKHVIPGRLLFKRVQFEKSRLFLLMFMLLQVAVKEYCFSKMLM